MRVAGLEIPHEEAPGCTSVTVLENKRRMLSFHKCHLLSSMWPYKASGHAKEVLWSVPSHGDNVVRLDYSIGTWYSSQSSPWRYTAARETALTGPHCRVPVEVGRSTSRTQAYILTIKSTSH